MSLLEEDPAPPFLKIAGAQKAARGISLAEIPVNNPHTAQETPLD